MEQSYLSSSWYRVSGLKLRLRSHARIHRAIFRGQLWYVLQDRTSGRFHRFTPETWFIISLLDGRRTIQEIWDMACAQLEDKVMTQDEVIHLLGQLHTTDVLFGDVPPDIGELADRGKKQRDRKLMMSFINPLALRFGLIDPDKFLQATLPLIRPLFSWVGALGFCLLFGYALMLAGVHWRALTKDVTDRVLSAENLILLLIAFPMIKAVHELGHAYAVKRWGGAVHEIGVMLLVFMPVPYVDASDSLAFQNKWHRAIVGGAGILVEIVLAALALIVWVNAEPGLVRAFAFNVMLIGGVSTLVFNGNPLLKFDGYYVLSDIIEIPNLASRANAYLGYLVQRYAFRIRSATSPVTAPGEAGWLFFYGFAAFFYRLTITAAIVTFVSRQFFIVGTLIALWAVILMLGVPVAKGMWFLLVNPALRHNRGRAFGVVAGTIAALAVALFLVPLPHSTIAQGIVWLPGNGIVNVGADGVVKEILAAPDSEVAQGMPLVRMEDPLLTAKVELLTIRVQELKARLAKQDIADEANSLIVKEELRLAEADLALAADRQKSLTVRSQASGTFILPGATDLVGRFLHRGETVGYVAEFDHPLIRVVVPEDEADLVRSRTRNVSVRLVGDMWRAVPASMIREVPALSDSLPSAALSTVGGGTISLDPTDPKQRRVVANLLHLDLRLDEDRTIPRIGSRVYVRFSYGAEPLVGRLYRGVRQVFLRVFQI
jgi:putative peptide zinc metalloprotease protein